MIYIVGINHWYQYKQDEKTTKFLDYVREIIKEKNITVLAEEWNKDADKLNNIERSNLSKIAEEFNLELVQIEALEKEQNNLGIMTRAQISDKATEQVPHIKNFEDIQKKEEIIRQFRKQNYEPRENYWLSLLKAYFGKSILLVCGDDHIKTFSGKLQNAGEHSVVLSTGVWTLPEFLE